MTTNTNTITVNGKNVSLSKTQLDDLANRAAKAKANSAALRNLTITPRSKHTAGDVLAGAGDRAAAARQAIIDATWEFLHAGKEIAILRASFPSDKLWGLFIKGSAFETGLTAQDRSDLIWLGNNYPVAVKAMKKAIEDGVSQIGISALRKRTKAMADSEGTNTTTRQRKTPKKASGKVNAGKAPEGGNVEAENTEAPSKDNGAAKVNRKVKMTAADLASNALESAVENGIDPQEFLQEVTKAVMEALTTA